MKFLTITTFLAATAVALPSGSGSSKGRDVDVQAAQQKCGTQTIASCCNNKIESGETYEKNKGLLSGVLSGLLSGGNGGSDGLGVFDKCSDLNLLGMFYLAYPAAVECQNRTNH